MADHQTPNHQDVPRDQVEALRRENAELRERVADLEKQALTDPLTGVNNRRAFDRELERMIAAKRRDGTEICLVFMDVDKLKQINDRKGHMRGDQLLKAFANGLALQLRPNDLLFRIGGDEFAIIMPECDRAKAQQVIKQLQKLIDQLTCSNDMPFSVSTGIVQVQETDTSDELCARADEAMYRTKTSSHR